MSGPSSTPRLALALVALGGLGGCPEAKAPEADPAQAVGLAKAMLSNMPPPGFRDCAPGEVMGGATLTMATLHRLTSTPLPPNPKQDGTVDAKFDTWTNPDELVSPAALVLATPGAAEVDRRRAAAELLAAPFYLVYRVDLVDAPMALGFKEAKRGTVGARAIRYDKQGVAQCVRNFAFQNDLARSERAITRSDKPQMDPQIVQALRDDLKEQMLKTVTSLGAARNAAPAPPAGSSAAAKPVETPDEPDEAGDTADAVPPPAGSSTGSSAGSAVGSAAVATPPKAPKTIAPVRKKLPAPAPAGAAEPAAPTPEPPPEPPAESGSAS